MILIVMMDIYYPFPVDDEYNRNENRLGCGRANRRHIEKDETRALETFSTIHTNILVVVVIHYILHVGENQLIIENVLAMILKYNLYKKH